LPNGLTRNAESSGDLRLRRPARHHIDRTYPPSLEVSRGRVRLGTGHDVMRTCLSRVRIRAVIGRVRSCAARHSPAARQALRD
jgi:hypothetical protein